MGAGSYLIAVELVVDSIRHGGTQRRLNIGASLTMALRRSKEEERSVWMEIADEGIDHGSHTSARHAFTCVLVNLLLTC